LQPASCILPAAIITQGERGVKPTRDSEAVGATLGQGFVGATIGQGQALPLPVAAPWGRDKPCPYRWSPPGAGTSPAPTGGRPIGQGFVGATLVVAPLVVAP